VGKFRSGAVWISTELAVGLGVWQIKKLENHGYAVALHFMHYNFCRIHKTLKVTPAMKAGLTDHDWSIEELCDLLPEPAVSKSTIERNYAS
jgi:hypothetical protein